MRNAASAGSNESYAVLHAGGGRVHLLRHRGSSNVNEAQLAAMGGRDRLEEMPWIPLVLAAKVAFDVANAGKLSVKQWTKNKAFCFWCLVAAAATFATAPLVVPEAYAAVLTAFDEWVAAFVTHVAAKGKVEPGTYRAYGYEPPSHLVADIKTRWRGLRMALGIPVAGSSPARQQVQGINRDASIFYKKGEGAKLRD